MSLLSENLQYWRAERPSEWKMDEFINGAKRLEAKIKSLENSLKSKLIIGGEYTCKCKLKYCNCNRHNIVTLLTDSEVTYKYLSTNINGNRYWDEGTTTHERFLELNNFIIEDKK